MEKCGTASKCIQHLFNYHFVIRLCKSTLSNLKEKNVFWQLHWWCISDTFLQYPTRYCHPDNTISETVINVTRFKPGTEVNITITPFSYWGKGESTQTTLITPGKNAALLIEYTYKYNKNVNIKSSWFKKNNKCIIF